MVFTSDAEERPTMKQLLEVMRIKDVDIATRSRHMSLHTLCRTDGALCIPPLDMDMFQ